jgi:Skp family chaperone for outer membrane proteins
MNHKFRTAALTITMALSFICLPRTSWAQESKIAVVDIQTLTLMSDEGKAVNDKLEKRFQAISAEMEKTRKDIEDKETRLRNQDRLMSAAAKQQLATEIDADKVKFDRKNQDYQKEMNDMQAELLQPVSAKVQAELSAFVNDKGFTLLIDLSAENGNVVWANPGNDITKEVMVRVNENFKRNGGAAPAPAGSPNPAAGTPQAPPASRPQAPAPTTTPPAAPKQ